MNTLTKRLTAGIIMASTGAIAQAAPQPKEIGRYGEWAAYTIQENGKKICYAASIPKKAEGKYTKRGDVYVLVTHRPAEKAFNVVSFSAGYSFAAGGTVAVKAAGKNFKLFTQEETAWAPNDVDATLVQAMSKGSDMVVTGKSKRGTQTRDTYSLRGSSAALKAIKSACNAP